MESLLSGLAQHSYSILFAVVFLEAVGIPIPAALALMIAGGASAGGSLRLSLVIACALSALMLGDTLMFLAGRYTGWWLLSLICRLSLNPESCILRSADSFYRRGRTLLVIAKFLPGINTMAPPMAGSMNMRIGQFFLLDLAGAMLYAGAYLSIGFVFSSILEPLMRGYRMFGRLLSLVLLTAVVAYVGYQIWMWSKARILRFVPRVLPSEAANGLSSGTAVIFDVRSHGYYDRNATRITGSKRLEPNALLRVKEDFPSEKLVYLYCT